LNTVVYYPHIFPSPDWLKLAAICWNKVYRLVPANWSYDPVDDPKGVNKLDQELGGILLPINAQEIALVEAQNNPDEGINKCFINWVEANQERLLQERMPLSHHQLWTTPFYVEKVTREVYDFLRQQGFQADGSFLYLPDYIANYYLSLCAAKVAQIAKCDSVTNEQKFTDIVFASSPLVAEVETAVIKAYLPEDLSSLEPSRIKDLRENLSVEKLKFQAEIQSLVDKYGKVSSVGELETVKRQIIAIATQQVDDVKKTFKRSKLKLALNTFSLSLTPPALVASVASMLGLGIVAPVAIATALSLFAAGALIDWNEAKSTKEDSPWSYIFNVEKMK